MNVLPCLILALTPTVEVQDGAPKERDWLKVEGASVVLDLSVEPTPSLLELVRGCEAVSGPRFYLYGPDEQALENQHASSTPAQRMRKEQLYGYIQGILRAHQFACATIATSPEPLVRIVRLQGEGIQALKSTILFVPHENVPQYADDHATLIETIIPLTYIQPQAATQMLTRFFSSQALEGFASYGHQHGEARGLMVVGFGPTVAGITELLHSIDIPGENLRGQDQVVCEVWFVPLGDLQRRIEESVLAKDFKGAWAMARNAGEPAQRLGRFQGQAVDGTSLEISSRAQGGEESLAASMTLSPRYQLNSSLQIGVELEVTGTGPSGGLRSRIIGGANLEESEDRVLLSSSSKGLILLFIGRR